MDTKNCNRTKLGIFSVLTIVVLGALWFRQTIHYSVLGCAALNASDSGVQFACSSDSACIRMSELLDAEKLKTLYRRDNDFCLTRSDENRKVLEERERLIRKCSYTGTPIFSTHSGPPFDGACKCDRSRCMPTSSSYP